MSPILFQIGSLPLYSFGVMVALGVGLSLFLMSRQVKKTGFPPGDFYLDMVLTVIFTGFLSARIYYVVQNYEWYLKNPLKVFALWEGGLIFYGGMVGSFLALCFVFRSKKISIPKGFDFIFPYVALTHAFGRLGCFLNGCCYGKECDLPWAVKFHETPHPVHPAQIYELIFNLLLFLFLRFRYEKKRFDGEVMALYFILYACGRFLIEFVRGDNPVWVVLTINQWISLLTVLTAGIYYFRKGGTSK